MNGFKAITRPDGKRVLVGLDTGVTYVPLEPAKPSWYDRWQPTESQLEFFRNMLRMLKDPDPQTGELPVWEIPATGSRYTVDKPGKTLTLIHGKPDEWHWKNVKAFGHLGYEVVIMRSLETGSGSIKRNTEE